MSYKMNSEVTKMSNEKKMLLMHYASMRMECNA